MTQHKKNILEFIISVIRNEILNEDMRTEIIKPILIYLLYYIVLLDHLIFL